MAKGARPTTRAAREALAGKSDIPESNVQVGEFTKRKTKDPFFGEVLHTTNKYFYVDQVSCLINRAVRLKFFCSVLL